MTRPGWGAGPFETLFSCATASTVPLLRWHRIAALEDVAARRSKLQGQERALAGAVDASPATLAGAVDAKPTALVGAVDATPTALATATGSIPHPGARFVTERRAPPGRTALLYLQSLPPRLLRQPEREQRTNRSPQTMRLPQEVSTMAKYLSKAWVDRGRAAVANDARFKHLSRGVAASILCIVHEQPTHADEVFYIDFEDGTILDLYSGPLAEFEARGLRPTFSVHGDYDTYRAIQEGHLTQTTALMKGRLKLKGSMLKALKHMRTLEAVTDVLRSVPTEY